MKTETLEPQSTDSRRPDRVGTLAVAQMHAPLWLIVTAFATVYLVWGSTYLGIRYAVESIPPLLMAAARHLSAGLLLFAFARPRTKAPSLIEWRDAVISGTLMLAIGNGAVTWAEKSVPSSIAALLVASTPSWMVLFDWLRPQGVRPRTIVIIGLFVGIIGVGLLARGHGEHHEAGYGWSVLALLAASLGWSGGSVFSRHAHKPSSPFLGVSMQMIAGGSVLLVLAALRGEFNQFSVSKVTALSFGSWLYLAIIGSLITYTAYVWLLHASTPARVATISYVNPLVAVILGCTIGHEVFSHEMFVAAILIVVAVVLIVRGGAHRAKDEKTADETELVSESP